MRIVPLRLRIIGLLALLAAVQGLSGIGKAYASDPIVGPNPSTTFVLIGSWYDSNVYLQQFVPADFTYKNILINDESYLRKGWVVKVDAEQMYIDDLIDGGVGNPDTMVVRRAWNGTWFASHNQGTSIKSRAVTVNISVQNVTDPDGMGAFEIDLTFPPEVEYVKMIPKTTWLGGTGRDVWCNGPAKIGDNTWQMGCWTTGDYGNPGYPLGPTGTGVIAAVTVLPPAPELEIGIVDLDGSYITQLDGDPMPATVRDIKVKIIECPDANLDGYVDSGDRLIVLKSAGDMGVDSGATLVNAVDDSQTSMDVSDQSLLSVGGTISIDAELMKVDALAEGTPDTMTVTRRYYPPVVMPHAANSRIYSGWYDGNRDGKITYTWPRDVNRDGVIDSGDALLAAKAAGMVCPSS